MQTSMTKRQAEQLRRLISYRHGKNGVRCKVDQRFDNRLGYRVLVEKGPEESPERFCFASHLEYFKSMKELSEKA